MGCKFNSQREMLIRKAFGWKTGDSFEYLEETIELIRYTLAYTNNSISG